jgi:hypothetical protein
MNIQQVDHIVYAAPDLQQGIEEIEKLTGLRAPPGGQHPGWGTRNALVSLGPAVYLEIVAPDPEQPPPAQPRPFGIDRLSRPRLVTWAAKSADLEGLEQAARESGIQLGEVISGSRNRPDGVLLSWRFTSPWTVAADGIVPFFIDWGGSPHPAGTPASGLALVDLRAEHPDVERTGQMLRSLGLTLPVRPGPEPALIAVLGGPRGLVELR